MGIPQSTLTAMKAAARPRLRWWQLSLRTLLALVTLAGALAFFHEPISAWAESTWQSWFPEPVPAPPPPPVVPFVCFGCGMG
jgi:hypothetical protein